MSSGTHPEIPDRNGPSTEELERLPDSFDGPFFEEVARRKSQGRDVKILLTAKDGQTGVGKSNCSDFLAYVLDTTQEGFSKHKATIDPQEFITKYNTLKEGSSLVMEEGEQFDARRAMASENVDATHQWQMARVREVCSIVNLPSPDSIDKRFEQLADFWIDVKRRGFAVIYKKRIHPIKRSIYYEKCQTLEWPNMDKSKTFRAMGRMKDDLLDDPERSDNYVRKSEVEKRLDKREKAVRKEVRNQFLTAIYSESQLTADEVANLSVVDISSSRIRQIASQHG
jgi:hypothetical protein